jgi:serine/threonine-protein kinase
VKYSPIDQTTNVAKPAMIGRFLISSELGRGAVGVVYLAKDPLIDRKVALKTFCPKTHSANAKRYKQQFINEARTVGNLDHPNIVRIYEATADHNTTYLVMEYLEGRSLQEMVPTGEKMSYADTAALMWKVTNALHYAHVRGVVHRDIKPANIFITDQNQPKLVDFGIAKSPNRIMEEDSEEEYTLFRNNLLGTPSYMAPEQAMGLPADARSDIYSAGVVMYELLTGTRPFDISDSVKLLEQIARRNPPEPHAVDANIPKSLSDIVVKAMSKRPEKRYQKAEDMAADIRRFVRDKRIRQPSTPVHRVAAVNESHTAALATAVIAKKPALPRWFLGVMLVIGSLALVALLLAV